MLYCYILKQQVDPLMPLFTYAGEYSNVAYGRIAFEVNHSGELEMRYGRIGHWVLKPIGAHHFSGTGEGETWMWSLKNIRFSSEAENVTIDLDPKENITFTRDVST